MKRNQGRMSDEKKKILENVVDNALKKNKAVFDRLDEI